MSAIVRVPERFLFHIILSHNAFILHIPYTGFNHSNLYLYAAGIKLRFVVSLHTHGLSHNTWLAS